MELTIKLKDKDALIVVDLQNDFLPGGALAVPHGDQIIEPIQKLLQHFQEANLPVFATRDWHPRNHCSFQEQGGPWPPHCIAGTWGAEFPKSFRLPPNAVVFSKATTPQKDAYSGFDGTELPSLLKSQNITHVFICGLATEYCVLNTVRDAKKHGLEVYLVIPAIHAIALKPTDESQALSQMEALGVNFVHSVSFIGA
jgi:nicotinamidase/pyrazinamidase